MVIKKSKKKRCSLKKQYSKAWNYLGVCKNFILFGIGIFFISALLGFFVPVPEELSEKILEFIKEILGQTEGLSHWGLFRFIFFNNIQSSFFAMILGVFFGIFPVLAAIANGYLVGFVSALSVQNAGVFSLWRLLPHGIFELPAIFISIGIGIKLGTFWFKKEPIKKLENDLLEALNAFFLIVLPLLIIAGIIEASLIFFL
jgi:stage II sporulation protein M